MAGESCLGRLLLGWLEGAKLDLNSVSPRYSKICQHILCKYMER
jgi:hypothetical protein